MTPTSSPTAIPTSPTIAVVITFYSKEGRIPPTATPIQQLPDLKAASLKEVTTYTTNSLPALSRPYRFFEMVLESSDHQYILDLSYVITDAEGQLSYQAIGNGQVQLNLTEGAKLYFWSNYGELQPIRLTA